MSLFFTLVSSVQRCTLTTPTHATWYASCPNPFLPSFKILGCLAHSKGSGHTFSLILGKKEVFLQLLSQISPPLCPQDVFSLSHSNVTNSNQFNPCCQILAYVKQYKGSNKYVPVYQYYAFFGPKCHLFKHPLAVCSVAHFLPQHMPFGMHPVLTHSPLPAKS